jgi:3-hydroxyacyl-[acyl-carrier-protein] dehydratase
MKKIDENKYYLDTDDIYAYLKNRPPMLMIDDVYVEPGVGAYTSKVLGEDEWYFQCHFPGNPMMPGVLQLESLFNTAAMPIKLLDGNKDKTTNIAQINSVKYKRQIVPRDKIDINIEIIRFRRGIANVKGTIQVAGEMCCEAEFVLAVLDDIVQVQ